MSQLEERVRVPLTALMTTQTISLSDAQQRVLAEWLTLKLIIAEHDNPRDAAFTAEDRLAFYQRRAIPDSLRLWLFWCGAAPWGSAYFRTSFTASHLPAAPDPTKKNLAEVAFGLADLLVVSIYDGPGVLGVTPAARAALQLWPMTGADLRWPPVMKLSASQAQRVAEVVRRFVTDPNIARFGTVASRS